MLFKRRNRPSYWERFRVFMWPRRSWSRSVNYVMHRVKRLSGSSHTIALGCAVGIFVSFTPIMGFHFLAAFTLAYIVGGNLLASALGTFAGNPITFPFIWASAYKFGHWILGQDAGEFSAAQLMNSFSNGFFSAIESTFEIYIKPMTIGGAPLGIVAGFFGYFIVKQLVETYQERRRYKSAQSVIDV